MYRKQRGGSSNAKGPGNWIEMGRRIAANCAIHFAALLGVDEDAHSFRILLSIRVRGDTPQLREVMNFGVTLSNPPSEQVLRDAESVIRAWGLRSEVPDTVISRLVSCFDSKFLLSLPRPTGLSEGRIRPHRSTVTYGIAKRRKL